MSPGAVVQIWWASLVSAHHDLMASLSATERERVAALDRPADRGRSLVAAALLRSAVSADLGCTPASVQIDRTCADCGAQHGAPQVVGPLPAGRHTPPFVSVSHSGLLVVVALCPTHPVGVDVQRIDDLAPGSDPAAWVAGEAGVKAGADPSTSLTQDVAAPLPGYAAALTVAGASTVEIVVRTRD